MALQTKCNKCVENFQISHELMQGLADPNIGRRLTAQEIQEAQNLLFDDGDVHDLLTQTLLLAAERAMEISHEDNDAEADLTTAEELTGRHYEER